MSRQKKHEQAPVWDLDFLQDWTVPVWELDSLSEWEASMEDIQTQWNDFAAELEAAYSDPAQSPEKAPLSRDKAERK